MSETDGWWPSKPGVPLNPEKDGVHRLRHQVSGLESDALWSCGGTWLDLSGDFSISHASTFYDYLGPCLTPNQATELQARVTKLEEMLDSAARVLHKAGEQFTTYANAHSAKGTVDGNAKAETNRKWAERCYNAHDAALFSEAITFVVPARNFGKSSGNVRNMLSAQSREIDRLRAELAALKEKQFNLSKAQPIKTAPRDGKEFWGICNSDAITMFWHTELEVFCSSFRRMQMAEG